MTDSEVLLGRARGLGAFQHSEVGEGGDPKEKKLHLIILGLTLGRPATSFLCYFN